MQTSPPALAAQEQVDFVDVPHVHTEILPAFSIEHVRELLNSMVRAGILAPPIRLNRRGKMAWPRGELLRALAVLRGQGGCVHGS